MDRICSPEGPPESSTDIGHPPVYLSKGERFDCCDIRAGGDQSWAIVIQSSQGNPRRWCRNSKWHRKAAWMLIPPPNSAQTTSMMTQLYWLLIAFPINSRYLQCYKVFHDIEPRAYRNTYFHTICLTSLGQWGTFTCTFYIHVVDSAAIGTEARPFRRDSKMLVY